MQAQTKDIAKIARQTQTQTVTVAGEFMSPSSQRAAFIASFGNGPILSKSVAEMTTQLERLGYDVVIVRSTDSGLQARWPDGYRPRATRVFRPNVGYDFGSWAAGMLQFPELTKRQHVLLLNDSIVGPFAPIDHIVADFEMSNADVWGAISTHQRAEHLQSFFVGYHGGLLSQRQMRSFWGSIKEQESKEALIDAYEIGLSKFCDAQLFTTTAAFPSEILVQDGANPTIHGWERLLELDFPFVKRELLTKSRHKAARENIVPFVADRFDVDIDQWYENPLL